jgi:hydrogenase 3 maturation protease
MESGKTLTNTWQNQLREIHKALSKKKPDPVFAVLGIGSEIRGDDAAGVLAVNALASLSKKTPLPPSVHLINCGTTPENFSGMLRKIQPDYILMLDAGDFGGEPAEIQLFSRELAVGFGASTHALPLATFADYLVSELNCDCSLLLIQPVCIDLLAPVNEEVESAATQAAEFLFQLLS